MAQSRISSLAIAGAWGYIGRKFCDAAQRLQLALSVYDTLSPPDDIDLRQTTIFNSEQAFYQQRADLFHLALHPEHRAQGLEILLRRSHTEPIWLLCEKPMAAPQSPHDCRALVQSIERSQAVALFDFPELFDPITRRILDFLRGHQEVKIDTLVMQRSKDREDPAIPRNQKRMVHIQYQESVHCLAFALYLLAHVRGWEPLFGRGLRVCATSQPYRPPNPSCYPHVVDGKCEYSLELGGVRIKGQTDFTRGADWSKRREITGSVDGRAFSIVADFLEGKKLLVIDGQTQDDVVHTNSYVEVIQSISRLRQHVPAHEVMSGIYPHPTFAHITYQLSSLLWRSSWDRTPIQLDSLDHLLLFDAGFAEAMPHFDKYT